MANPSKAKGDRAERECVEAIVALAPHLVRERPQRMLGAGRKDDVGDLSVVDGVTMQVKALKSVATAVRQAAMGAEAQRLNSMDRFAVGLVPIPRARVGDPTRVRWLASAIHWPDPEVGSRATTEHFLVSKFANVQAWLTDITIDIPIDQRVVELAMAGKPTLWVGTLQAWLNDYAASVSYSAASSG